MSDTPLFQIPHVAPTQANKEATINTAFNKMEAALAERIRIDFTGSPQATSYTFSNTEWNSYWLFEFRLHDGEKDIVIPADRQRPFVVANGGSHDLHVIIDGIAPGPGTEIIVAPGNAGYIYAMGDKLYALSEGAGGIGATFSLTLEDGPAVGVATFANPGTEIIRFLNSQFELSLSGATVLVALNAALEEAANRSDVAIFLPGEPLDDVYLSRIAFASATYFTDDTACQITCRVAPTADITFFITSQTDGDTPEAAEGTATILAGQKIGTVTFTDGEIVCLPGSILSIIGPTVADATCADVSITLKGFKIGA